MFSSGKVPHRPEDNLAMTALLPSVYLFSKVCAFEQNNSLAACKHLYFTAPAHLVNKVCLSSAVATFVCTCSPLMTKPHQPVRVCQCGRCFPRKFSHFFVPWGGQWQYSYYMSASRVHAFPLQTGAFGVEWVPLSHADLVQILFFLFLLTESCFRCLHSLDVRDKHTSYVLCVCARACRFVCVDVCLCVYICVNTSVE